MGRNQPSGAVCLPLLSSPVSLSISHPRGRGHPGKTSGKEVGWGRGTPLRTPSRHACPVMSPIHLPSQGWPQNRWPHESQGSPGPPPGMPCPAPLWLEPVGGEGAGRLAGGSFSLPPEQR